MRVFVQDLLESKNQQSSHAEAITGSLSAHMSRGPHATPDSFGVRRKMLKIKNWGAF
jgi:hypothetical protein